MRFSMLALTPSVKRMAARRRALLYGRAFISTLLLAGCANVEVQNRLASQELARQSKPPGSVYIGWRVFQDRCASCHGSDATGMKGAPDLLPLVREMGSRQFVSLVLQRYDLNLQTPRVKNAGTSGRDSASATHQTLIETVMQRQEQPLTMPAWGGEPRVSVHILDLYAYISARAQGKQDPGRPAQ